MAFRKRSDPIGYVLRDEFPLYEYYYKSEPIRPLSSRSLIASNDDGKRRADELQRIEQRDSELALLQLSRPAEFSELYSAATRRADEAAAARAERAERELFFNQPSASADYEHWAKLSYWTLNEGVALWFGRDPNRVTWPLLKPFTEVSSFARQFRKALDIAERAAATDQIANSNLPGFFIAWANRIGPQFPEELTALVAAKGPIADWRAAYEQEKLAHAETRARADELARSAPTKADETQGKPLKIRADREQSLLRVIAGLWALSELPKEHNTAADKISGLLVSWGWDKPAVGTIADTILAEAAKLPRLTPQNRI